MSKCQTPEIVRAKEFIDVIKIYLESEKVL